MKFPISEIVAFSGQGKSIAQNTPFTISRLVPSISKFMGNIKKPLLIEILGGSEGKPILTRGSLSIVFNKYRQINSQKTIDLPQNL